MWRDMLLREEEYLPHLWKKVGAVMYLDLLYSAPPPLSHYFQS